MNSKFPFDYTDYWILTCAHNVLDKRAEDKKIIMPEKIEIIFGKYKSLDNIEVLNSYESIPVPNVRDNEELPSEL